MYKKVIEILLAIATLSELSNEVTIELCTIKRS
jgi:hypothetical protein